MPTVEDNVRGGWNAKVKEIVLLGYISSDANLPDYRQVFETWQMISNIRSVGAWLVGDIRTDVGLAVVHLYRKRIIVTFAQDGSKQDLGKALNSGLKHGDLARGILEQFMVLIGDENARIRCHPIVRCGSLRKTDMFTGARKGGQYINDGLTSFYTRVYDSDIGEVAIVRISRHITIVYGLGDTLMQDIINLIYDDLLYSAKIEANNVFDLYDSMNKYILPLEINLFVQKLFYGLALFAAFSTSFVTFLTDSIGIIRMGETGPYIELGALASAGSKAILTFSGLVILWLAIRKFVKTGRLGT